MKTKTKLIKRLPYKRLPRNTGLSVSLILFRVSSMMKTRKKPLNKREKNRLKSMERMKLRNFL
jgi:hypothetical protein